jgi:hypothetical protein
MHRVEAFPVFSVNRSRIVEQAPDESKNQPQKPVDLPFWRVVISVIQASFGVQSNRNRERDFGSRSIWPFVVAALLFTAIFILVLALIVKLALPN